MSDDMTDSEDMYEDDDRYGSVRADDNKPHHRPVHAWDGWEGCWVEAED